MINGRGKRGEHMTAIHQAVINFKFVKEVAEFARRLKEWKKFNIRIQKKKVCF